MNRECEWQALARAYTANRKRHPKHAWCGLASMHVLAFGRDCCMCVIARTDERKRVLAGPDSPWRVLTLLGPDNITRAVAYWRAGDGYWEARGVRVALSQRSRGPKTFRG